MGSFVVRRAGLVLAVAVQLFGIGAGFAVIIDATLVRAVLVPACQRVLGRAAWYAPAPLRRLQQRVGLTEAG